MAENKKEPKEVDQVKHAKKLFDSYSAVLEHRLGRSPTLDEIVASIKSGIVQPSPQNPSQGVETLSKQPATSPTASGVSALTAPVAAPMDKADNKELQQVQPQQAQPDLLAPIAPQQQQVATPKIFQMKILYGMKNDNGTQTPDPATPLFYTDGVRHFDCSDDSWLDTPPAMAQHLMSRPLQHSPDNHDLVDAIMHGVIDDEDYAALDQAGMIDDRGRKLRELLGKLSSQYEEYDALANNVEPVEKTDEFDHLHTSEDSSPDPVEGSNWDVNSDVQEVIEHPQVEGSNAFADLATNSFGHGVDPRTVAALKDMIREEIKEMMKDGLPK